MWHALGAPHRAPAAASGRKRSRRSKDYAADAGADARLGRLSCAASAALRSTVAEALAACPAAGPAKKLPDEADSLPAGLARVGGGAPTAFDMSGLQGLLNVRAPRCARGAASLGGWAAGCGRCAASTL